MFLNNKSVITDFLIFQDAEIKDLSIGLVHFIDRNFYLKSHFNHYVKGFTVINSQFELWHVVLKTIK